MSKRREITIVYDVEDSKRRIVLGIIFSILFGVLFAVELFLPMGYYLIMGMVCITTIIISVLMQNFLKYTKFKVFFGLSILTLGVVIGTIFSKIWLNGGTIILNSIIESWNRENGTIYYLYVTNDANVEISTMLFSVTVFLIITIIVNMLIYFGNHGGVILVNFLVFAFYVIGQMGNNPIIILAMVVLLIAYIAIIESEKELVKRSKAYWVIVATSVIAVTAVILATIHMIPDGHMDNIRGKLVKDIERITFGESDLCDGDLTDIPDRRDIASVRLQVTTDCTDALYFKGFVGARYTGHSWTELDNEAYQGENKDLQQYLLDSKYSPLTMFTMFIALSDGYNNDTFDVKETSYKVENVSASSKYIYVPYTCQNGSFQYYDNINKDMNVRNSLIEQKDIYEFSTLEIGIEEYLDLYNNGCLTDKDALEVNSKYLDIEQSYHEYVDKYYLDVPEDLRTYFDSNLSQTKFEGAADTIIYVRKYLKNEVVFSDKISFDYSGEGDFVVELLEKNKQGHSVHYATAATMMLRYYGIPARYVEGYRRAATGAKETSLFTRNAHAWVEIYRYGMGWVPIDVTPGYYIETENQTLPAADQNISPPVSPPTPPTQDVQEGVNNNNSESGNPPPVENDADDWLHQLFMFLWWLLLLLLLIILIILIRRRIILYKQNKRIKSEDWKDSILFMAGLTWRMCKRGGIAIDQTNPDECRDDMNEAFKADIKMDFAKLTDIIKRVKYSDGMKEEDDYVVVKAYMDVVRNKVYHKASFGKKLRIKYIDVLC